MCASQLELQISGTHTTEENSKAVEEIKRGEIGRKTSTLVHSLFHPVGQQCFLHPNMRLLVRVGMLLEGTEHKRERTHGHGQQGGDC